MLHHIQALQQHIPSCSRRVFFTRAFPQHHKASLQHLPLKFTSSSNNRGSSLLFNNQHRLFSTKPNFEKELESKYFEFQKLEKDIYTWWEGKGYFQPNSGKELAPDQKKFVMAMPPPNVTGYLHMGHAIFLALQDIMARYHRMKGASTLWIPGTDHAGIATQLLVERQLLSEGTSRVDLGREKFLSRVWQWKEEKGGYITNQMRRLGASADWTHEKFTLEPSMNEAVTEAFVRLYEKGLVYRGNYMVNWSPNLQTAVSDLEVDYVEEEGKLYYFKYELADSTTGESIPVATTRPETILGDTAVCVHPDDDRYKKFIGKMVRVPMLNRLIPVIADEYVDREFGTGALKITPAHDVNDYTLGKKHKQPMINIMNKDATINHIGGSTYQGLDRFVCRTKLWSDMKDAGLVIKEEKHMQRVPRSQRGGEIIEPLISPQWFVKMDNMAQKAVDVVRSGEMKIIPERFEKVWYNWLENIHDWCISRQLWWGHRIPVYYVKQDSKGASTSEIIDDQAQPNFIVARTEEEAYRVARAKYGAQVELEQDEDVLDTWFSSGLWPFATLGWPNEEHNMKSDLAKYYPGDVLETGYDILFFWVARMVTMGLELTGKAPFKVVYLHGLVRDGQGQKMSKTKGNVIDPIDTISQFGTDALRYSLVTGSTPGQDVPLSLERVESNRNFANKLWNVGKYVQHALSSTSCGVSREELIVGRLMTKEEIDGLLLPERFIVSKVHKLIDVVSSHLDRYEFGEAGKALYDFLWDDLADWYIEASKTHTRHEDLQVQKSTFKVLVYAWDIYLRLLHPYMPYVTETLWQNVPHSEESLMVATWPSFSNDASNAAPTYVDEDALKLFNKFQNLIRSIRNVRAQYNVDPGRKISILVQSSSEVLTKVLNEEAKALIMLARIEEEGLEFIPWSSGANQDKIDVAKAFHDKGPFIHLIVEDGLEAYLPQSGLLDKEKELARLNKQSEKLQKEISGLEGRLTNKSFVEKAPEILVKEAKDKLSDLQVQLAAIHKSIDSLSST